jgi:hypothetical protein
MQAQNMHLCRSIAQVQTTMAQLQIEANRESSPHNFLLSIFNEHGWKIELITEQ